MYFKYIFFRANIVMKLEYRQCIPVRKSNSILASVVYREVIMSWKIRVQNRFLYLMSFTVKQLDEGFIILLELKSIY